MSFCDRAHVYDDGVMSAHSETRECLQKVRACEAPGVMFFSNKTNKIGEAAPFWVCDRRAGLTAENESAKAGAAVADGKPRRPGAR